MTENYPVRLVWRTLGYAPSRYSYRGHAYDEADLRTALVRLAGEWPTYGCPRLTAPLWCEGRKVNHKRVGRLIGELGLCAKHPKRK